MHRKAIRDAVLAALAADARFGGFTVLPAWAAGVDDVALPAYGVATPDEQASRAAPDLIARRVDLHVAVKRKGGDDIEDEMDADAAAVEAVMEAALQGVAINWHLARTQLQISGEAGTRVGTAALMFSVLVHTTPV